MDAHVYEIDEGGETYWWAATTLQKALNAHFDYQRSCGIPETDLSSICGEMIEDDQNLAVDGGRKPCGLWAAETIGKPVPMVGTTAI